MIASAITDKGVTTSNTATFQTMANNIKSISTSTAKTYNITKNLDNVTVSNSDTSIEEYRCYSATIRANTNYTLNSVIITMDGEEKNP